MGQVKRAMRHSFSTPWTPLDLSPTPSDEQSEPSPASPIHEWQFLDAGEEVSSDEATGDQLTEDSSEAQFVALQSTEREHTAFQAGEEAWQSVASSEYDSEYEVQSLSSNSSPVAASVHSRASAMQRTNALAVETTYREPTEVTELRLDFDGLRLCEGQRIWHTFARRQARLHQVAGKVFRIAKLLHLILDHCQWRDLTRFRLVSKDWASIIVVIYNYREWMLAQCGIWQCGSDLRQPCRGICRWIKKLYADRDAIKELYDDRDAIKELYDDRDAIKEVRHAHSPHQALN